MICQPSFYHNWMIHVNDPSISDPAMCICFNNYVLIGFPEDDQLLQSSQEEVNLSDTAYVTL